MLLIDGLSLGNRFDYDCCQQEHDTHSFLFNKPLFPETQAEPVSKKLFQIIVAVQPTTVIHADYVIRA